MKGKMLIVSAPSGSGKSTIVQWLMQEHPELKLYFSISCTSRAPRGTEQNGVEYFFLSPEEFKAKIQNDEFLEYEEVYENRFYGTLKQQVENQRAIGQNVVFDVDVKGGVNIKKYYGDEALSLFIQPPSVEELRRRLEGRGTDTAEAIDESMYYEKRYLQSMLKDLADSLIPFQDESGMWYQVPNKPREGKNYLETSGTAIFAYSLMKGFRTQILDAPELQGAGVKAFKGICEKYLSTEGGKLGLDGICLVAGLGPDKSPRRDGSFEYYMSEPIVKDDAKGVGPFILAYNEFNLIAN